MNGMRKGGVLGKLFRENISKTFLNVTFGMIPDPVDQMLAGVGKPSPCMTIDMPGIEWIFCSFYHWVCDSSFNLSKFNMLKVDLSLLTYSNYSVIPLFSGAKHK